MAQITVPRFDELAYEQARRDRLRSAIPVTIAVLALFAVTFAGALTLRTLVEFGAWFLAG
jgi:hypothetical protein